MCGIPLKSHPNPTNSRSCQVQGLNEGREASHFQHVLQLLYSKAVILCREIAYDLKKCKD